LPAPLPTLLTMLLWLAAGLTGLFSLLGFLSRRDWKFELFSHFRLQYALLLGMCAAGFVLVSDLPGALFSLAFLGGNLGLILPMYRRPARGKREGMATRLFFANILGTNTNYARLKQSILAADADMVLLVEVRPNHLQALLPALSGYPYQFTQPDSHNFGIALFSRLPGAGLRCALHPGAGRPAALGRRPLHPAGHPPLPAQEPYTGCPPGSPA
jgi:endonuclease/exonuclease/phosphatase (EEP) superfamily protein YafD